MKSIQFFAAAMLIVVSFPVQAQEPPDPTPGATKPVREQNLDGNEWIAVHEQGTAKVEVQGVADVYVTGGEIDAHITGGQVEVTNKVLVEVDNFPAEQGVFVNDGRLSSVTKVWRQHFSFGPEGTREVNFGPIDATTITVSANAGYEEIAINPEFILAFYSPLVVSNTPLLVIADTDADFRFVSQSFTYPIPLNRIAIECFNEHKNCRLDVTVVGF